MKKDKMRSSRMMQITSNNNAMSFGTACSSIKSSGYSDEYEYSIFPRRIRNTDDGVSENSIRIIKYTQSPVVIVEVKRKILCFLSLCKYGVDLKSDDNKNKVKYFNLRDFNGNNEIYNITYLSNNSQEVTPNFNTYMYTMNDKDQQIRLINFLEDQISRQSNQITKTIPDQDQIFYNIKLPSPDCIFNSTGYPFIPDMRKSQKLHHILTVDENDKIFYFANYTISEDGLKSSYSVKIMRPIEIIHDVSSTNPNISWNGKIKITIDTDWKITMSFETNDGWNPNNQWIYGRLWFASGNDKVESDANLSGESEYDVIFTNPNDNNRGYTDAVVTTHTLKAFRNRDQQNNVRVSIQKENTSRFPPSLKVFEENLIVFNPFDPNAKKHYIKEGDDEIYVLRYQGRIEGYYDGERQTFPSMSIDISGDIKVKLPGRFKSGNGYKFIGENMFRYKYLVDAYKLDSSNNPRPFVPFFGYNHINKSYYNLDERNVVGQYNNMLYLNDNDVAYEIDNKTGVWYVSLKNKIQIVRTLSLGINIVLDIDEKWNMALVLYSLIETEIGLPITFGWVYGKMILETNISDYTNNNFVNNTILQNRIKIAQHTGDGIGMQRGMYYSARPCGQGANDCSNLILITTSNALSKKLLPVTNLNDFLRIDVTMLNYSGSFVSGVQGEVLTYSPRISYVDRIGIREPNVNIIGKYIKYHTDNLNIKINIDPVNIRRTGTGYPDFSNVTREFWGGSSSYYLTMNRDAIVNISDALEYRYVQEDGSFEVSIIRPISISYEIKYKYEYVTNREWNVILQIEIDKNWKVTYTYTTPNDAWFQTENKGKNIQGEMRIFVNEVNNTNNTEVTLPKSNERYLINNNSIKDADNYSFIGWADKKGLTKTVSYQGNDSNGNNSNKKKFRSLNNLIRFDAKFASYYFLYNDKIPGKDDDSFVIDTYMDKSPQFCDKLFDNTITLCCVQPILYFCYPENKSKPVVDVLTVLDVRQENNVYFINVSDYVYADSKNDITYEISDVADNATATLSNTTLSITSKEAGSCILYATQGNFKISIKLQWFQLYFCYPENKSVPITNVINVKLIYPRNKFSYPFYPYIRVLDYLAVDYKNPKTYNFSNVSGGPYEISNFDGPVGFNTILIVKSNKGQGECILTVNQGSITISITMKWDICGESDLRREEWCLFNF